MRRLSFLASVLTTTVAAAISAGPADAACPCPVVVQTSIPRVGATNVPTNAKFTVLADRLGQVKDTTGTVFDSDSALRIELRDAAGTKVQGSTVRTLVAGITTMFRFEPDTDVKLPANQTIKAYAVDGMGMSHQVGEFTTGAADDTTPPVFAGLTAFETSIDTYPAGSACIDKVTAVNRAVAHAAAGTDDATPAEELRYELVIYKAASTVPTIPTAVVLGGMAEFDLVQSSAKCGLASFGAFVAGTSYCGRVRAVDLAGNSSGSSVELCGLLARRTVDADGNVTGVTDEGGGGCAIAPATEPSALADAAEAPCGTCGRGSLVWPATGLLSALVVLRLVRRRRTRA